MKGFSEEGGSGGIVCAINTTSQWAVLGLETAGSNVTQKFCVFNIMCLNCSEKASVMLFGIPFLNKILINQSGLIPSHVSALSHMLVTAPLSWCPVASAGAWMCSHREGPGGFRSKREMFQESNWAVTWDVAQIDCRWMANKLVKAFIFT